MSSSSSSSSQQVCKIYSKTDIFTVFVQLLLAFLALCSLYIKRIQETPRRTFRTWFLDVSKQACGACYAHVLNMIVAYIIAMNVLGDTKTTLQDECAWYAMSYLIDTTLGLALAIVGLTILDRFANKYNWEAFKDSGVYVGKQGLKHWMLQVVAWMSILTVVKLIIFGIMVLGFKGLAWVGNILFHPLERNIRFELLFVMILFPGVMNVVYFWIADGFLKAKKEQHKAHEPTGEEERDRKEALLDSDAEEGNKTEVAESDTSSHVSQTPPAKEI